MADQAAVQAWLDRRRRLALDGDVDVDTGDPLNPGTVSGAALREELSEGGLPGAAELPEHLSESALNATYVLREEYVAGGGQSLVIDVRATIGGTPGVSDDYAGLKAITDALDDSGTVLHFDGPFRIGPGSGRWYGLRIARSNVRLSWVPGAKLVLDNLNAGAGTGHGIVVEGNVENVDLGDATVEWATKPASRSYGDGIRVVGPAAISPTTAPRNIRAGRVTVRRSPQAGVTLYGIGSFYADTIRLEDTLADGFHVNACYVGPIVNRVEAIGCGDDGCAFVTYYHPTNLTQYNDGGAPFVSPDITTRNNNGARVGSVYASGGGAGNGLRVEGAYDVKVGAVYATGRNAAVHVDSVLSDGATYANTALASRLVEVESVVSAGNDVGLQVQAHNGADWASNDGRGLFDVRVGTVTSTSADKDYSLLIVQARGVIVDRLIGVREALIQNFASVTIGDLGRLTGTLNVQGGTLRRLDQQSSSGGGGATIPVLARLQGFDAINTDPGPCNLLQGLGTTPLQFVQKLYTPVAISVSEVIYAMGSPGAGASGYYVAVYDGNGTLCPGAVSGNFTGMFGSNADATATLGAAAEIPADSFFYVYLKVGTATSQAQLRAVEPLTHQLLNVGLTKGTVAPSSPIAPRWGRPANDWTGATPPATLGDISADWRGFFVGVR
jgi:hypothetical protein